VRLYDIWRDGSKRAPGPVAGEAPRRKGTAVSELACDTVVLATARVPNGELFNELKARKEEWVEQEIGAVYAIGDCRAPRLIADSIFDGHRLAREFESANPMKAKPFIRERILWGQEMIPALGK
jgi:dimethylamine/trimethylamine dehydrogenase